MTRQDDLTLLHRYTDNPSLIKHMLAVEAACRAYARKFNADEDIWGTVGLLHDFDYQRWPDPPDHPLQGATILQDAVDFDCGSGDSTSKVTIILRQRAFLRWR